LPAGFGQIGQGTRVSVAKIPLSVGRLWAGGLGTLLGSFVAVEHCLCRYRERLDNATVVG